MEILLFLILGVLIVIIAALVSFIRWCKETMRKAKQHPILEQKLSAAYQKIWEHEKKIAKMQANQYSYDVPKLRSKLRDVTVERDQYKALVEQFAIDQPDFQNLQELKVQLQKITYEVDHKKSELQRYSELLDTQRRTYHHLTQLNDLGKTFSYEINRIFRNEYNISLFFDSIANGELNKAFEKRIQFFDFDFSATILSEDKKYRVSLKNCTCEHYQFNCKARGVPCKHMVCFAYTLGLLQGYHDECYKKTSDTIERLNQLVSEIEIKKEELKQINSAINKAQKNKDKLTGELKILKNEASTLKRELARETQKRTDK